MGTASVCGSFYVRDVSVVGRCLPELSADVRECPLLSGEKGTKLLRELGWGLLGVEKADISGLAMNSRRVIAART